jgi:hypothetical protein
MTLQLQPISIREAKAFVKKYHRHHKAPRGVLFALALNNGHKVIAVSIVGRPVARFNQDGWTAEVTRLWLIEGHKNACSKLYQISKRAAQAMGYRRVPTYILSSEPGSSLKGAGWKLINAAPTEQKQLWEAHL